MLTFWLSSNNREVVVKGNVAARTDVEKWTTTKAV